MSDFGKKKNHRSGSFSRRTPGSGSGSGMDMDLLSSMTNRLTQVEKINTSLRKEVRDKTQKIFSLEKKNELLSVAASDDFMKKYEKSLKERDELKKEVGQMKEFLADYGLKWVGKDETPEGKFDSNAIDNELKFKGPSYRNNLPKEIDTEVLSKRIEELNFIAERSKIVNKNGVNQIAHQEDLKIWFFKNGLLLKGFPFYPYYAKEAQSVLSDILDGFFPYDLKKRYPNGVPLKPMDCTEETYKANDHKQKKLLGIDDFEKVDAVMDKK